MANYEDLGYDGYMERTIFSGNDAFPVDMGASGQVSEVLNAATMTPSEISAAIPPGGLTPSTVISTRNPGEDLFSSNFVSGTSGYAIYGNGDVEFNNGTFRGALTASTIDIGGSDSTSFHVDINGNMWLGAATFAAGTFSVSSAGSLIATTGRIANWYINTNTLSSGAVEASSNVLIDSANSLIRLGPTSGSYVTIDGANQRIRSSNYVSGFAGAGFTLEPNLLEVGNIAARGLIRSSVMQYNNATVHSGSQWIAQGGDVLDVDMTAADNSTFTIKGTDTFAVNDRLRIKDGTNDEWLLVTGTGSAPTYTVTRDQAGAYAANSNPAWKKGASVINYGQSGAGGIYLTASDTNAPYISVFTHAGSPWSTLTTQLRLGNLNGYLGYVADTFGLGVGSSSGTDANITIDPTNGIRIRNGTTNKITFDNSGNASFVGSVAIGTGGNLHSGQTAYNTGAGWWLEYNAGTPRLSIGDGTVENSLTWDGTTLSINGSALSNQAIFGDGSDGDVTISSNTSLSSDMFYNNLTISAGFTLNPNGYRIFVKGTLTVESTALIARNGNNGGAGGNGTNAVSGVGSTANPGGTAGTAGAALANGSLPGASVGIAGVAGKDGNSQKNGSYTFNGIAGANGGAGASVTKAMVAAGKDGGVGGNGGSCTGASGATGGSLGAGGTTTGTILNKIRTYVAAYLLYDQQAGNWFTTSGGSGSGGGGASAGAAHANDPTFDCGSGGAGGSGGSGSSGGVVEIFARTIVNNGTIEALGGNGGNGGNAGTSQAAVNACAGGSGGGGGGGAGNGGVVILIYSKYSGSGSNLATAGTKGTGGTKAVGVAVGGGTANDGTNGSDGVDGTAGLVITLQQ